MACDQLPLLIQGTTSIALIVAFVGALAVFLRQWVRLERTLREWKHKQNEWEG